MPAHRKPSNKRLLGVGLIAVVIAAVIIVAIFFRPGAFSVIAEGQGASIKLDFAESRVDLNQLLDKLVEEAGGGHDAEAKRRLDRFRELGSQTLNANPKFYEWLIKKAEIAYVSSCSFASFEAPPSPASFPHCTVSGFHSGITTSGTGGGSAIVGFGRGFPTTEPVNRKKTKMPATVLIKAARPDVTTVTRQTINRKSKLR